MLVAISRSETGRPAVRVGGARANTAGVVTATLTLELAAEEPGYAVLYNRTNSRRIVVPIQVLETTEGSSGLRLQPIAAARRHTGRSHALAEQREVKRGALAYGALRPDVTPMRLHDVASDG